MNMHLEDQVVLISGATGGVGMECCKAFLAEGAKLAVTGRSQAKMDALAAELGVGPDKLYTHVGDIADEAAVKAFVDGAY